jgi:quercetin dioxygenase-like cupin family protein
MTEQRPFVGHAGDGWDGIEREGYAAGEPSRVVRHTLVGGRKADPADPGPAIELRYFEVPPQAASRLERHEHEHVVIVGEGEGLAIVGDEVRAVGPRDVVYVAPGRVHQFVNRGDATFGFFCAVSAHRDPGQALDEATLEGLRASAAGAFIDPAASPPRTPR